MVNKVFNTPVMILRKKMEGENSIEELAYTLTKQMDIPLITLPEYSSSIRGLRANIQFIKNIDAPVLHFFSTEAYLLPFAKGKKIITYHDLGTIFNSRNELYRIIRKFLFIYPSKYWADAITFISNESMKEYIGFTHYKKKNKLSVIYNPFNPRLLKIERRGDSNLIFTILHIGTALRKNLISTIKACVGLDVELVIIGKLLDEQRNLLESEGIQFRNYVDISFEEVMQQYSYCDIVSFPSSYEGFGMPIIEANAVGKPIFVGDIPILHEIGGEAVVYVDPHDIDEIRKIILQLKNDSEFRNSLIEKGKENIKRFEISSITQMYLDLYEGIVQ